MSDNTNCGKCVPF
ncbi:uncharacterized protein FTOL_13689 [Fusarium torulosum]|uniref:Uncharacterized protein n=1 Tax=Fusarium torulosum TaxID=33205 RepID=A0AAE8MPT9_9HYPO|nr:uncharacterized protein FTOL_13689 [Fusarium torulosum]